MTFYIILDKIIKIGCDTVSIHKKQIFSRYVTTIISVIILAFIFFQSIKSANQSSTDSGRVLTFLNSLASLVGLDNPFTHEGVRTLAHFGEFSVLGMALSAMYSTYLNKHTSVLLLSVGSSVLTAVIDECIQLFSDGRAFQFKDICIDIAGALCGCIFIVLLLFIYWKRKIKKQG